MAWAAERGVALGDLEDALDAHGCFCDCEAVLNLPDGSELALIDEEERADESNPWLLPPDFAVADHARTYTHILVATHQPQYGCHADEGEILVPAPQGARPGKRIRRLVHFFVGLRTGLPSEIGFVSAREPASAAGFAHTVRHSGQVGLASFGERESAFVLGRLAALPPATPVGVCFTEITVLTRRRTEMRIGKVVLRK